MGKQGVQARTDRVELTSRVDEGQTGAVPGDAFGERAARYFGTLFDTADTEILQRQRPIEIEGRDLGSRAGVYVGRFGEAARGE